MVWLIPKYTNKGHRTVMISNIYICTVVYIIIRLLLQLPKYIIKNVSYSTYHKKKLLRLCDYVNTSLRNTEILAKIFLYI